MHFAARVAASGHGGQVLLSRRARSSSSVELTRPRRASAEGPLGRRARSTSSATKTSRRSSRSRTRTFPCPRALPRPRAGAGEVVAAPGAEHRLLTLTGPGGTGKTRLALRGSRPRSDPAYKDGVFWIPLAPLRDATLVLGQIAQTLGSKDGLAEHIADRRCSASSTTSSRSWMPRLSSPASCRLPQPGRPRHEQGAPARPGRGRVPRPTARRSEAVRSSASARRLEPYPTRSPSSALASTSFRSRSSSPPRARRSRPRRSWTALPASRPAQGRSRRRSAAADAARDDRVELRPALGARSSALFRALSVFAGGCTLEAAEEVAEADPDTLQSLLDKSLCARVTLEPATGCSRRSASTHAESSRSPPRPSDSHDVTSRTTSPSPRTSTSAARSASTSSGGSKRSATISAAPSIPRSRSNPSRRSIWPGGLASTGTGEASIAKDGRGSRLLSRAAPAAPASARARALSEAGNLAFWQADLDAAEQLGREALALAREHGDRSGSGYALNLLGMIAGIR